VYFSIANLSDFPDPRNQNHPILSSSVVELKAFICQTNAADYTLQNEYDIYMTGDPHQTVNFHISRKLRDLSRRNLHKHLAGGRARLLYC